VTYSVRIQQVQNSWILVGFCTGRGFGNVNNYLHAESVYYYAFNGGYLFEGGVKRQALEGSSAGETIHCLADLPNGNFLWLKDKKEVGRCEVPPKMKGRKIYFSALLYSKDDQIDIFL
jgi:hydroxymethylpyrimidine pyrophosphatase-like HAD family hydrolase